MIGSASSRRRAVWVIGTRQLSTHPICPPPSCPSYIFCRGCRPRPGCSCCSGFGLAAALVWPPRGSIKFLPYRTGIRTASPTACRARAALGCASGLCFLRGRQRPCFVIQRCRCSRLYPSNYIFGAKTFSSNWCVGVCDRAGRLRAAGLSARPREEGLGSNLIFAGACSPTRSTTLTSDYSRHAVGQPFRYFTAPITSILRERIARD